MNIIYYDNNLIVCIKPAGVISTDEEGGMPQLLREALGDDKADIRAVHRLDQVVSGLMVYAQSNEAASELSRQIRCGNFHKSYLAVVHGVPEQRKGRFEDILLRSKEKRKTFVINKPARGAQNAILDYELLGSNGDRSLVAIELITGRTHQIRAQFSHRRLPLLGDRKYGAGEDNCRIALWSYSLSFINPETGKRMSFKVKPPREYPWTDFDTSLFPK
ncbi:MAG: RluA family pseudouridine synthase [Oscillospiraceae bacterium]|nr:RluA family pseudouridine synthase [Oscillospiraceae bacterium]